MNSNTTGLAAAALRAAGEDDAADAGAAFLADLQIGACDEFGAIAYDQTAFDAGIDADRGQWTRASAQGALGLGLPAYGGIGTVAPVDAGLDDVTCPAVPVAAGRALGARLGRVGRRRRFGDPHRGGLPAGGDRGRHARTPRPISLGSATADADGGVVKTVTIPADLEPGVHTIELVGQTSGVEVAVDVEVLPARGCRRRRAPADRIRIG